ncbi:substrate-binding domain-containing protein [Tropicimonas sp. TH_r6]|uniref:LacI family DNA-binding transcriptional regulator n=1 Tax=Tropicimonas sp. TH_r6 TaxID=3082085 RepID=UPI002954F98F|nr:substrate-binding domain-containing protein [Tropicimonas sp. TH_r6]MDV7142459.1 substrate-binding domain-containing protein [Tropicimonas sp. TH_r6]
MESDRKKPATLRQVAERAGVSAATASLVLNRKGEISEATRTRVLRAMEAMNYVPRGEKARGEDLPADSVHTVRFLKIARHGQTVNRNHSVFISDYIDGMSMEATRRDYSLQVVTHEGDDISSILRGMAGADLRGIVALGTELSDADIREILGCGIPNVIIDTHRPFMGGNFVDMDNDQLVHRALDHLMKQGFRRIGMVSSYSSVMNFRLRHDAFLRGMAAHRLEIVPDDILSVESTLEGAYADSVEQITPGKVADAYLCANDIIAFGFIRALRERGIRVPEDVSVIGIDNLPMAAVFDPPLTSLNVPKQKIGAMAIRILDDLIIAASPQPAVKVLVAGDLVLRESVRLRENASRKTASV